MKYKYGDLVYVIENIKNINPMQVMLFAEDRNKYLCAKCRKINFYKQTLGAALYFIFVSEDDLLPLDREMLDYDYIAGTGRVFNLKYTWIPENVDYDFYSIYDWRNGREKLLRKFIKKYPLPFVNDVDYRSKIKVKPVNDIIE